MTYCRYMAAWLPHEPHYLHILKQCRYPDIKSTTCLQTGGAFLMSQVLSQNLKSHMLFELLW